MLLGRGTAHLLLDGQNDFFDPCGHRRVGANDKRSAVSEPDTCPGSWAGYQEPGVGLGSSLGQTLPDPSARVERRRAWLKEGWLTSTRADRTRSAYESLARP